MTDGVCNMGMTPLFDLIVTFCVKQLGKSERSKSSMGVQQNEESGPTYGLLRTLVLPVNVWQGCVVLIHGDAATLVVIRCFENFL